MDKHCLLDTQTIFFVECVCVCVHACVLCVPQDGKVDVISLLFLLCRVYDVEPGAM